MTAPRIDECTYAVVDVETTGIDAGRDRIVEVAVLTCDWAGTVIDRFETLVRPDDPGLSGTRAEMLAEAPAFSDLAGNVLSRLAGGVVAGHNVSFDLRFLDAELGRIGLHLPTHRYVCTRDLATLLGCDVANRTLAALCAYFGIAFDRWHTAADDTAATAAVLAALLERAVSYGRVHLGAVESVWSGVGGTWPVLEPSTRLHARDPVRWPPAGDQPGSRRAREASFRRLGAGTASPSGAQIIDSQSGDGPAETTPAGGTLTGGTTSASERWWEGDLRGLEGINELQAVIVPAFRANDDPELAAALLALADLLRRHGGRDTEVRATFAEAYDVSGRRDDIDRLNVLVDRWWAYLASLRDTAGQIELMLLAMDDTRISSPVARLEAEISRSYPSEPVVAARLAREAMAALVRRGTPADLASRWDVLVGFVAVLERNGQSDEAKLLVDEAWTAGCDAPPLLEPLSRRLEQTADYARAAEVCARVLRAPAGRFDPALVAALRKRYRRCQQQLARAGTLFG